MRRASSDLTGSWLSRLWSGVVVLALCGALAPAGSRAADHTVEGSLFDRVFAGNAVATGHDIPYPFEALVNRIRGYIKADGGNDSGIQQVLIPLGRSLQRYAADPNYFSSPRIVVAVDGAPSRFAAKDGLVLKDRFFLGYQKKSNVIEVISYNNKRGRFEFQIVDNYGPGLEPAVSTAERGVCTGCHQNEGPIWSDPPWEETNDNPEIARRLKSFANQFHGVQTGYKRPSRMRSHSISNSVDRANMLAGLQLLWRHGCGSSPDCRGELLLAVLQEGLRVRASSGNVLPSGGASMERLGNRLQNTLPQGIQVPNPRITNRNPIQDRHVTRAMDPQTHRPPLYALHPVKLPELRELVSGLAGQFTETDISALDRALIKKRQCTRPVVTTSSVRCAISSAMLGEWRRRIRFICGQWNSGKFQIEGRFYLAEGVPILGKIDRLQFGTGEILYDLELKAGALHKNIDAAAVVLEVRDGSDDRRARRSDGRALENVTLAWRSLTEGVTNPDQELFRGNNNGTATLDVVDDFSWIPRAVSRLVKKAHSGMTDMLADRSFDSAKMVVAVLEEVDGVKSSHFDQAGADGVCPPQTGSTPEPREKFKHDRY